jgi:RNA polymerase sigma-70 factor (ECF subfamily)
VREVDEAYRREWARVLATTVRLVGDLDLAEECVQDAFVRAVEVWTAEGVPPNPGGWLTTTARRRAIDVLRRERALRAKLPLLVEPEPAPPAPDDDLLRLVFTCAHPALAPDARLTLTLRMVCGLTTAQVAQALLVPEATAAARLTRAKKKIAAARIPYRVPADRDLPPRLDTVLTVVHVLFTCGHVGDGDSLVQPVLVERALDLARMLHDLMPDEREVRGLLALLLLTDARRPARTDGDGRLVLLEDQDRSLWRADAAAEGRALVRGAMGLSRYALQAAIAAVHSEAATWDDTDWPQIVALYDLLLGVEPSPVVALNRAVAVSFALGPGAGLDALPNDPRLRTYPYLPATRADLLRRLGRPDEAAAAYEEALALTSNGAERAFLQRRLSEVHRPA